MKAVVMRATGAPDVLHVEESRHRNQAPVKCSYGLKLSASTSARRSYMQAQSADSSPAR
jgi:hypothetical protein